MRLFRSVLPVPLLPLAAAAEASTGEVPYLSEAIAACSLLVSLGALALSLRAGSQSRTADALSVLHGVWTDVRDPYANPADPDLDAAIDVANALKLTAAYWSSGGVERAVLHAVFYPRFRDMYESLIAHSAVFRGETFSGRDLLADTDVRDVFLELFAFDDQLKRRRGTK